MGSGNRERPTVLPLHNDLRILLDEARRRGDIDDTLSLRGYIGATREAASPIAPALAVSLTPEGGGTGDYDGLVLGTAIDAALTALLGYVVWIIAESVPPGAYRDAFPVTVVEDQSG